MKISKKIRENVVCQKKVWEKKRRNMKIRQNTKVNFY